MFTFVAVNHALYSDTSCHNIPSVSRQLAIRSIQTAWNRNVVDLSTKTIGLHRRYSKRGSVPGGRHCCRGFDLMKFKTVSKRVDYFNRCVIPVFRLYQLTFTSKIGKNWDASGHWFPPIRVGDGGGGGRWHVLPSQIPGKYFSDKCHVKFGHFLANIT